MTGEDLTETLKQFEARAKEIAPCEFASCTELPNNEFIVNARTKSEPKKVIGIFRARHIGLDQFRLMYWLEFTPPVDPKLLNPSNLSAYEIMTAQSYDAATLFQDTLRSPLESFSELRHLQN